ncbi:hypothetical protein [Leadbetterella byssophila]|uniref:hypothetical protein n=1 Tax=Leadbetterella byssophila TaxID=316068 RepID=UPI0039A1756B
MQELDFSDSDAMIPSVLNNITAHRLIGIELVLGKIFDEIGFNQIKGELLRDLVFYRLVYPKSKLKTTEYLQGKAIQKTRAIGIWINFIKLTKKRFSKLVLNIQNQFWTTK